MQRLGRPGAQIIPARASVRVALAHFEDRPIALDEVNGFNLSPFRRHLPPGRNVPIGDKSLRLASDPDDLFAFDFASAEPFQHERRQIILTSTRGSSNGVVLWIRLQLDEELAYENQPGAGARSHWAALFYRFGDGREVEQGGTAVVNAAHDLERLQIWFS
jgi:hypothetical protein